MKLCEYGCNQEAKHQFKNGKWCCEDHFTKCPSVKKRNSFGQLGKIISKYTKLKQSISQKERWNDTIGLKEKYSKRMKEKYKNPNERLKHKNFMIELWHDDNFRQKHKKGQKKYFDNNSKNTIENIKQKYKIFSKVEKLRYKPNTKKIQVQCKMCKKWFTPDSKKFYERIIQLENPLGNDGCYFYCSDKCKQECPLYNLHNDPFKIDNKIYTQDEYQTFRKFVLEIDNYICQYCEEKAEYVHHERPQKLEPFFALDPDLAWSVCKVCHYKYGHKDECSTGKLAYKKCF